MKEKKYKHMTLDDRIEIQECLNKGITFKDIGRRISKDPTTISKEVKKHLVVYTNSFTATDKCCPKLLKAPFVCNGCEKRNHSNCRYPRHKYVAREAQKSYENLLVEAREGIPLNQESFYETEKIISKAVKQGQHIYHILQTHNLPVSKSSVYRHINKGYYTISNIDLPRAVKFKPRHSKTSKFVPKKAKEGRTYADFLEHISDNNIINFVEMDTVIGRIGGKVILTLHFNAFNFMVGILIENKTAAEVSAKITALKTKLKLDGFSFGKIMPLILTDNGGEFSNVSAIENDDSGTKETHLFFCDPNAPYEKPHIEKNHTLFRDIVPKGSSFDGFTQDTVNLIFSHVNAIKRQNFNGKSAYDLFSFAYSPELAQSFGISFVNPKNVIQSPNLLK
ncbi:MAG: IS30 family transposase [Clostridia bacterium]|nr:IS30 family transposase [Clostridia bacterium]